MMSVTREGKRFILATALIATAAANTGNNLIYLILALMVALIVLAYAMLRLNLSRISLDVSVHRPVFAGDETPVFFSFPTESDFSLPIRST